MLGLVCACGRRGFEQPIDAIGPGYCQTATFTNPGASSIKDDFTQPYTNQWAFIDLVSPCIAQVGNELVATPPTDLTPKYCYAFTLGDVHMTCDSVFVKVPEVTNPLLRVQTLVYLTPLDGSGNFTLLYEAGGFGMGASLDTIQYASYDAAQDVWWRLTELDGEVIFDASPDGVAWHEKMRTKTVVSLAHAQIAIGDGTYPTVPANPGQARFRCFNTPPPCN